MPESTDALVRKLAEAGIGFMVNFPGGGCMDLPAEEVLAYLQDRDAWFAQACGVSKAHYLAWLETLPRQRRRGPVPSGQPERSALQEPHGADPRPPRVRPAASVLRGPQGAPGHADLDAVATWCL